MAAAMADHDQDRAATDRPPSGGVEELQRTVLEAIRAGRAVLDAAESVLQDRAAGDALVRAVGDVARQAGEVVAGLAARARAAAGHETGADGDGDHDGDDGGGDGDGDDGGGGVQRIPVG